MAKPPVKHPGGRPPLDPADETVKVTISLPSRQFKAYSDHARSHDLSVPEVIRRQLRRPAGRVKP